MEISKATFGVVTAVCVTVGAGAAILMNGTRPAPLSVETASASTSPAPLVDASEALVAPASAASVAVPATEVPAALAPATERERSARAGVSTPASRPSVPRATAPERDARPKEPARESAASPVPSPAPLPVMTAPLSPVPNAPPAPLFEELTVSADSVIGLQVETSVTSERARVEDQVIAEVTRDVRVGDRVAIPSGSKAYGEVTLVERGGRVRERARLGVRFTSIVLGDGTRVPIDTDVILREGSSPTSESAARIGGGAIGGAIIGGLLGGGRGAVLGGSAGAGAGTAAVLAGGRNAATLPSGTPVTVRLLQPTTVTVEK